MTDTQATEKSITIRWSALYASLYHFLGYAFIQGFGDAGEQALREAIHDYGSYRAGHVRREHMASGMDLNLANMMNFGDMPNTDSLESEGRVCTPAYFGITVAECTLFNTWQDADGIPVGRIYCEEVHEPLYCEYADGVTLDMPEFMTKGDSICTFILTQPGAPKEIVRPALDKHPEAKIARLYGLLYQFLARKMADTFGAEGVVALREALSNHVSREGNSLKEELAVVAGPALETKSRFDKPFSSIAGRAVYESWLEMEGDENSVSAIYIDMLMSE